MPSLIPPHTPRPTPRPTPRLTPALLLTAAAAVTSLAAPAHAIVNFGTNPFDGIFVNGYVGAFSFYDRGYFGGNATVANIEAGFIWNGHEVQDDRGIFLLNFSDPSINATTPAYFDAHATAVGNALAGFGLPFYQAGVALTANLWSGAIASSFIDPGDGQYGGAFNTTAASFAGPYYQASVGGVNNTTTFRNFINFGTADIISSSWGGDSAGDGNSYQSVTIDALAHTSGKLFVFSAGNSGPAANSIGSPADGLNAFVVGSLGNPNPAPGLGTAYDRPSDFSSRGPSNFFIPADPDGNTGTNIPAARARVDIAAPGEGLTLAAYGGLTGGNAFANPANTFTENNFYYTNLAGTSFSTPIVSGGAALLVDLARNEFATNPAAVDGRVLKSVLMNSAFKTVGWTNNAIVASGVSITSQGLDYAVGAGRLDLTAAHTNFTAGTTDLPGLAPGPIANLGWDYAALNTATTSTFADYPITTALLGETTFTATLSWYAAATFNPTTLETQYGSFFNLDLELYRLGQDLNLTLVAASISLYNSSEQIYFTLPESGQYVLRVKNAGAIYNFSNTTTLPYALAWSATIIPEPTALLMILPTIPLLSRRRR